MTSLATATPLVPIFLAIATVTAGVESARGLSAPKAVAAAGPVE
jgi:hypothetical protein